MKKINKQHRRDFLKKLGYSFAAGSAASVMPQLNFLGHAMAAQSRQFTDYKAIVRLELNGGCDSYSMLMPRDSTSPGSRFDTYFNSRGGAYTNGIGVGYDFADTLPVSATGMNAGNYGLNPEFKDRPHNNGPIPTPGIQSLYNNGELAFLANVGSLIEPINKHELENELKPIPKARFSHVDQQFMWRTGGSSDRALGWGASLIGEILDNGVDNSIFPACFSMVYNSLFNDSLIPGTSFPVPSYTLGSTGANQLSNYSGTTPRNLALNDLFNEDSFNVFSQEYKKSFNQAKDYANDINSLLSQGAGSTAPGDGWGRINVPYQTTGAFDPINNQYPNAEVTVEGVDYTNTLLRQIQTIARMIKVSRNPATGINAKRQVYTITLPNFDTHFNQMQGNNFFLKMASLSQAIGYFSEAMKEIGAEDEVTLFTSSDFARTLSPNGTGTDHAWGGMQFVMGGAVNGGKVYGRYPNLELNADNNSEKDWSFARGQYIPTTSIDQMMATIAKWMGADNTHLDIIFPNLGNFNTSDLGFMI